MQKIVANAQRAGIIANEGSWKAPQHAWSSLNDIDKTNIAIGIYCDAANSAGEGSITIIDANTGKPLASVVNGHFRE